MSKKQLSLEILSDHMRNNSYDIAKMVTHVALYVRKSRPTAKLYTAEDIEKDLQTQRETLIRLCEEKGWSYVIYEEIVSGESIKARPKMTALLKEISKGMFDAVIVTKYDRLGRGSGGDQEKILIELRQAATVIIEHDGRLLNPLNRGDLEQMNMLGFFSNTEYTGIVERLTRGKRERARAGQWVSGATPYGYDFNRKTRKLMLNETKASVYREQILLPFLEGESTGAIADALNRMKIPSPRNKKWSKDTIAKLLKSEVYCGDIVYNKTVGSKGKDPSLNRTPFRKIKEEDWTVAENAHPFLKTRQEHKEVLAIFNVKGSKMRNIPRVFHPLSTFVKCYFCGKSMKIARIAKKETTFKACDCKKNRGGAVYLVSDTIIMLLHAYRKQMSITIDNPNSEAEKINIQNEINDLQKEIALEYLAIERIEEAYETDANYSYEKRTERIEKREKNISKLKQSLEIKGVELASFKTLSVDEKLKEIDKSIEKITNSDDEQDLSKYYKNIIKEIIWKREVDGEVEITIEFKP